MTTLSHAVRTAALLGLLSPIGAGLAHAQVAPPVPPRPAMAPDAPDAPTRAWPAQVFYVNGEQSADRGYLGITPHYVSGPDDTLGILVQDVEEGLAAHNAGIRRGARLVSIDGTDLRLDPRDLGDRVAEVLPERRLRRVLERKEPRDTVSVIVLQDGRKDTRRVVLSESPMARSIRTISSGRRVLGLSFSQRGSMRDTAGLMIVSISTGGAADKAGLNEGDRLVSIDGIDLRVSAADAGTPEGVEVRISRLRRALEATRDSQAVRLVVNSDGRQRTVSAIPTHERGFTFSTSGLEGMAEGLRGAVRANIDLSGQRIAIAQARENAALERSELRREMSRLRTDEMNGRWTRDDGEEQSRSRGTIRGRTDGATLVLGGLSLASVDRDFAQQFGRGSEEGALVVRTRRDWEPLKAGDVILSVDGRSVRDGNSLDISFDRGRDQRIEILRGGRKETITLPSMR